MANTWLQKEDQKKIIYIMGGNETKIAFVLMGKIHTKYIKHLKAIPWEEIASLDGGT